MSTRTAEHEAAVRLMLEYLGKGNCIYLLRWEGCIVWTPLFEVADGAERDGWGKITQVIFPDGRTVIK